MKWTGNIAGVSGATDTNATDSNEAIDDDILTTGVEDATTPNETGVSTLVAESPEIQSLTTSNLLTYVICHTRTLAYDSVKVDSYAYNGIL